MKNKNSKIIIWGCGVDGVENKKILDLCNIPVFAWCDRDKQGQIFDNINIMSVKNVIKDFRDAIIIIGSRKFGNEMYDVLIKEGFPLENIVKPEYGLLMANCGNQYFDVFPSMENEIFIDAGAYNGDTLIEYLNWAGKNHKKAYCMELQKDMVQYIIQRISENNLKDIYVENKAAWNKLEDLSILERGPSSQINSNISNNSIKGINIDTMVGDDEITFIKMDIEGAELKALEGAQNTIRKYRPRLAICIYHKPTDIILIADYILGLNPNYKFYIRHYASNMWETVLYAIDKRG